ncbi:hypothetical protein [Pontibacter pamirensis]|uniref:hypothetical protein n=1 Tax=Pontibacter pamirensis TaxID=2562824 RepID=UPI0013898D09|nr:hypothetical protein [Pontibacter pamirensis]
MKRFRNKVILAFCSAAIFFIACQKDEQPPQADVDIRDLYVGQYICEVKKTNYQAKVLLGSYTDTIEVVKLGEDKLAINNLQNVQMPEVKYHNGNEARPVYVALATVVVFEKDILNITYGLDSAVYELMGVKKL